MSQQLRDTSLIDGKKEQRKLNKNGGFSFFFLVRRKSEEEMVWKTDIFLKSFNEVASLCFSWVRQIELFQLIVEFNFNQVSGCNQLRLGKAAVRSQPIISLSKDFTCLVFLTMWEWIFQIIFLHLLVQATKWWKFIF